MKPFSDYANDALYFVPSCVEFRLNLIDGFKLALILNNDNVVDDFAQHPLAVLAMKKRSVAGTTARPAPPPPVPLKTKKGTQEAPPPGGKTCSSKTFGDITCECHH